MSMDKKIEDLVAQNERDAKRHEQYKKLKRHIFHSFAKGRNSYGTNVLMAQYHVEDLMISWGDSPEEVEFEDDFNIHMIDKCLHGTQIFLKWEGLRRKVISKKYDVYDCLCTFLEDLEYERNR